MTQIYNKGKDSYSVCSPDFQLKKSAEVAREALEKEIASLKTDADVHRREIAAAQDKIRKEQKRYNVLFEPAKLVAQEQSRSAVVKLQATVTALIEQDENAKSGRRSIRRS